MGLEINKKDGDFSYHDSRCDDVSQHTGLLGSLTSCEYAQIDRGVFEGRFREVSFSGLRFIVEQQNRSVLKRGILTNGQCTISFMRQCDDGARFTQRKFGTQFAAFLPCEVEFEVFLPPSEALIIAVDEKALQSLAQRDEHWIAKHGKTLAMSKLGDSARLSNFVDHLMSNIEEYGSTLHSSGNVQFLTDCVMTELLDVFGVPDNTFRQNDIERAYRITRTANDYIESKSDLPISILELCRVLDLSRRTLQASFVRIYGIGPQAYLRMIRLNRARQTLCNPYEPNRSVTEVAMRFGFFHLARFAHDYYQQFGELPSETLKR